MRAPLSRGCVIAVLGAESTGKTELARALTQRLAQHGIAATMVPEYLREWCEREARTPRPDEQAGIAAEQGRRIARAAQSGVAVADTTALMTAVYSHLLFDDASLYEDALLAQSGYTLTLLTALDLPWVADGLQRDGPHVREPVDRLVRAALRRGGIAHAVVHGRGEERLANAWSALRLPAMASARTALAPGDDKGWAAACERCSDPACEHRLFTDLLSQRN